MNRNFVNFTATYLNVKSILFGPSAFADNFTLNLSTAFGVPSSFRANLITLVIFPFFALTIFIAIASPLLLSRLKFASATVEKRSCHVPSNGGDRDSDYSTSSPEDEVAPSKPSVASFVGSTLDKSLAT